MDVDFGKPLNQLMAAVRLAPSAGHRWSDDSGGGG